MTQHTHSSVSVNTVAGGVNTTGITHGSSPTKSRIINNPGNASSEGSMVPPTGRNSVEEEYRRTLEHSTAGVQTNPAEQHTHSHGAVKAVAGSSHKHTTRNQNVGSPLVHGERKAQDGQGPAAAPAKVNFPPASDKASWKQANDTLSAIFEKSSSCSSKPEAPCFRASGAGAEIWED